ncbi:histone-lysine N-methyltransferase EZA1-like isoform X2 [Durio zibethinus]|uniref:Histone-lysine N-methyltransferase EZA1-like isoform X2 n=1 Tax=Durio zibethinus TaxID=66656 RepID=A0A6P6B0Z9_DURZI|nr:histone-lysine N-methyltransferase EZA1-like isoform X2 [Durio zibethinus]
MVSKASDSSSKSGKSHGEDSGGGVGNLTFKLNQLKRQIQAERTALIKEKVEKNRLKIESHISEILSATSSRNVLCMEENGFGKMLSSRIEIPLCKYTGFAQGSGDRDYANGHEVVSSISAKLPYVEKLPPYTTWIFLDKNQRMAEDQSVVGRRRIYYDQRGSEALICSDSEEDIAEPEEEKHEFSEGEDRILWTVSQEYGLGEEILNAISQFIGVTVSEIQERHGTLAEKYSDQNIKDSEDSGSEKGISLDKSLSLSAALDSFDNLFCRRCLLFDCRLHGCSQTLINPSEKQPYWSEYEDDRKPCSDQCYLQLRALQDVPEGSVSNALHGVKTTTLEEKEDQAASSDAKEPKTNVAADLMQYERGISEEARPVTSEGICSSEGAGEAQNLEISSMPIDNCESSGKRKASQERNRQLDDSEHCSDGSQDSGSKKQKTVLALGVAIKSSEAIPSQDQSSRAKSNKSRNHHVGTLNENEAQITAKNTQNESSEQGLETFACPASASGDKTEDNISEGAKDVTAVPELKWSSSEWKPIERELYLKGVEIFGKNSCLIARNLLSGLKTCIEVSSYMCDAGASTLHRSIVTSSFLEENGKSETDYMEQEMSTRPRLLRRRGRTRKLKYSWKSAGHPSMWKRIADGKNQSCKQYTPCGCQSMCGKQCPCMHNGTCCEKYCGCSKSCKNRFRGCHCAKSQCRSRQCPCFAAGRECDPDVCRNCWVSCGGGSLGEPPKRGDGQCGNMRLLLRQQQRILLAKSDVAGWGAFLKNSVNKNDYLGEYTGELISHREADKRGKIYDRANSSFLFDLNDQYVLDAYRKGDKLKFANHSSNPNCYAKVMLVAGDHRVGIFAKERIEASEELFYDYRYGPDQAPAWARKPEGSKRDDTSVSQGRAKKYQSH